MSDDLFHQYNREAWLTSFAKQVEPLIRQEAGLKASRPYRISCGWPSRRGTALKNRTIGQCQVSGSVKGIQDIFISPTIDDAKAVAETIVHELLHAMLPPGAGHRKPFSQAAKAVGLEGPPTTTVAGEGLAARLKAIVDKLGPYPHDRIPVDAFPKQKTRMLKIMCPICGYVSRTTSKWIEEVGTPICRQCGVEFIEPDDEDQATDPLVAAEQTIEFQVKPSPEDAAKFKRLKMRVNADPRFSIRMFRRGRVCRWFVLDYGDEQLGATPARVTPAAGRQEAIDLIESLRAGLLTYADLDPEVDDIDVDFENEYESDPAEDQDDLMYLGDDEDEDPDYDDGEVSPEDEEAFALEQAKREAWAELGR